MRFSAVLRFGACCITLSGVLASLLFPCTLSGDLLGSTTLSGALISILLSIPLSGVVVSFGVLTAGSEGIMIHGRHRVIDPHVLVHHLVHMDIGYVDCMNSLLVYDTVFVLPMCKLLPISRRIQG